MSSLVANISPSISQNSNSQNSYQTNHKSNFAKTANVIGFSGLIKSASFEFFPPLNSDGFSDLENKIIACFSLPMH